MSRRSGEWLTIREACEVFEISPSRLRKKVKSGEIRSSNVVQRGKTVLAVNSADVAEQCFIRKEAISVPSDREKERNIIEALERGQRVRLRDIGITAVISGSAGATTQSFTSWLVANGPTFAANMFEKLTTALSALIGSAPPGVVPAAPLGPPAMLGGGLTSTPREAERTEKEKQKNNEE